MIVCRDCKYLLDDAGDLFCEMRSYQRFLHFPEQTSCIHAERADGLTECCATCKYFKEDDCNGIECEKEIFDYTNRAYLAIGALKCDKWQPREEKE